VGVKGDVILRDMAIKDIFPEELPGNGVIRMGGSETIENRFARAAVLGLLRNDYKKRKERGQPASDKRSAVPAYGQILVVGREGPDLGPSVQRLLGEEDLNTSEQAGGLMTISVVNMGMDAAGMALDRPQGEEPGRVVVLQTDQDGYEGFLGLMERERQVLSFALLALRK